MQYEIKAPIEVKPFKNLRPETVCYANLQTTQKIPPRLNRILPSPGLLRGINWFKTDVSRLPIGLIFKGYTVQTNLRRIISQKTEEFDTEAITYIKDLWFEDCLL